MTMTTPYGLSRRSWTLITWVIENQCCTALFDGDGNEHVCNKLKGLSPLSHHLLNHACFEIVSIYLISFLHRA